jgi:hypothetical protein
LKTERPRAADVLLLIVVVADPVAAQLSVRGRVVAVLVPNPRVSQGLDHAQPVLKQTEKSPNLGHVQGPILARSQIVPGQILERSPLIVTIPALDPTPGHQISDPSPVKLPKRDQSARKEANPEVDPDHQINIANIQTATWLVFAIL